MLREHTGLSHPRVIASDANPHCRLVGSTQHARAQTNVTGCDRPAINIKTQVPSASIHQAKCGGVEHVRFKDENIYLDNPARLGALWQDLKP